MVENSAEPFDNFVPRFHKNPVLILQTGKQGMI